MKVQEARLENLVNAVARLEEAIHVDKQDGLVGEMMRDAIIQRFEFTLEVAWKYLRHMLLDLGVFAQDIASPKKVIREAFANGIITDGDIWVEMVASRNILSHTYNQQDAIQFEDKIINIYFPVFKQLADNLAAQA